MEGREPRTPVRVWPPARHPPYRHLSLPQWALCSNASSHVMSCHFYHSTTAINNRLLSLVPSHDGLPSVTIGASSWMEDGSAGELWVHMILNAREAVDHADDTLTPRDCSTTCAEGASMCLPERPRHPRSTRTSCIRTKGTCKRPGSSGRKGRGETYPCGWTCRGFGPFARSLRTNAACSSGTRVARSFWRPLTSARALSSPTVFPPRAVRGVRVVSEAQAQDSLCQSLAAYLNALVPACAQAVAVADVGLGLAIRSQQSLPAVRLFASSAEVLTGRRRTPKVPRRRPRRCRLRPGQGGAGRRNSGPPAAGPASHRRTVWAEPSWS